MTTSNLITGIIFKVLPYQETSKLVYVYTVYGKLSFIARGSQTIKSSQRYLTQYLNLISFEKPNNFEKLNTFKSLTLLDDLAEIKSNYDLTKKAASLLELIERTVYSDERHPKIFEQLIMAIENIKQPTSYLVFSLRMLLILGYHFNFNGNKKGIKGYNISENSLVYNDEAKLVDISFLETKLVLDLIVEGHDLRVDNLSSDVLVKLHNFVKLFYEYYLNISLKLIVS